jgi:cytoskeletal protein CcmA (bactofilin family)
MCPSEYTCSLFAEGELPEAEAREIALHLENCYSCDRLVNALRAESRVLVQCLQDIDLDEAAEAPDLSPVSRDLSVGRFALWIVGAALAFRASTSILFGFKLPPELAWLDPRGWALNLPVTVDAAAYAIQNGSVAVTGVAEAAAIAAFAIAVLAGMTRFLKRSAAIGTVVGVVLLIGLFSAPGEAIDLRHGAAASVPADEIVDDTLIAGGAGAAGTVNIAGTIKGDLVVGGDLVTISGTVEGNVIVAARRVEISGTVGGSVLSAAQTLVVSGQVAGNVASFSGNLNVARTASIGGNTAAFSGDSVIEGATQRDLFTFAGVLDFRGSVGRNVVFRGGQATLSAPANIGGDLRAYVEREENVRIDSGVVIAGNRDINLVVSEAGPSRYLTVRFYIWQVVRILAAFVTGLVLFRLLPWLAPASLVSGKDWLKAGGIGFVLLVTVPIAAIIVGITIIGLPLALLALALWIAGLYVSKILVAEFIGRSLTKESGAVSLLAGIVLVVVAVNLPWIGGLINFVLCLLGLGAIALALYSVATRRRVPLPA